MHILHKQLHIGGMTCINCQNKIEQALRCTDGIQDARVSYDRQTARITYDTDIISLKDITALIEKLDYRVITEPEKIRPDIRRTACLIAVILLLYALLQQSGILNLLAPSRLADSQMGYGMLFLTGLITSIHCIAMCGGINLSQCIPQKDAGHSQNQISVLFPALSYNLGRVISYAVTGAILGGAGIFLGAGYGNGMSVLLQGIIKIIAGIFMIIMGINMLDLFPWLRSFSIRMPKALAVKIGTRKVKETRPLFVGLLNGLMPCGPLQSMQLVALASGSPVTGAFSMLAFSLGTVPLMLGMGSVVSILGRRFTHAVMKAGSVLVVVLGLSMLSQGGSLSGLLLPDRLMYLILFAGIAGVITCIPFRKSVWKTISIAAAAVFLIGGGMLRGHIFASDSQDEASAAVGTASSADGVQIVTSTLIPGKYPNITVQAGIPVRWIIDAPAGSINGCNYKMIIPEYQLDHKFTQGENIIEFTPTKAGTVSYSCWMGMIRGNIFVMDEDSSSDVPIPSDELVSSDVPVPSGYQIPSGQLAIAQPGEDENGSPIQEVSIDLTDDGFQPAVIVVQSKLPVIWRINLDMDSADAAAGTQLLAPEYSTKLNLVPGENALYLYPQSSFQVSTGDHSFYAYIKVVEQLDSIDEASIRQEAQQLETLIYPDSIFESQGMSCCS